MLLRSSIFVGILFAHCCPTLADDYSNCLRSPSTQARLQACQGAAGDTNNSTVKRARAFRRLGGLRAQAGAHEQAVQDFTSAIALAGSDVGAYEKRALSLLVLGQLNRAEKDLTLAISRRPLVVQLYVQRGYVHMVAKQYGRAIRDFDVALARNPKHAVALNNRGLAYRKKGDLARAIQDYSAAIERAPTYAQAYVNRGYAYESSGKKAAAIDDFQQALKFDPGVDGARAGLQRLEAKQNSIGANSLAKEGGQLVGTLCSRCHAVGRKGDSPLTKAPRFRDLQKRYPLLALREPISRGIAAPHDEMPKLHLRSNDIDKIVAYVNSLRTPGK